MDTKKPDDGPGDPLGRLGEVARPDELADDLCEGPGRLRRVFGLGRMALELCDARVYRPQLCDKLGLALRLHYANSPPAAAVGPACPLALCLTGGPLRLASRLALGRTTSLNAC